MNFFVVRISRLLLRKCVIFIFEEYLEKSRGNINNILNEVKVRLERKMEKVKSRVYSIREFGF